MDTGAAVSVAALTPFPASWTCLCCAKAGRATRAHGRKEGTTQAHSPAIPKLVSGMRALPDAAGITARNGPDGLHLLLAKGAAKTRAGESVLVIALTLVDVRQFK